MNNTIWSIKNKNDLEDFKDLGIDCDILNILINRNINTKEKINDFLNCTLDDISNPFSMEDMEKSVNIIISSINLNKKIYIYGDYDVDGITSCSLLFLALTKIGANVHYYIPIREEGYGLNNLALKDIKDNGGDLVITVDCGISSIKELEYANSINLDVIITDHHEINGVLPPAKAIINPKRDENVYTFRYLAGVGTAFMLTLALYEKMNIREDAFEFLDIVAIGTVADIVPLIQENRIFVKFGLKLLEKTKNIGLKVLLDLIYHEKDRSLNSNDIGFKIAPIFNAAGRLKDAKKAVELLSCLDQEKALNIARELYELNAKRKKLDSEILEKVEAQILEKKLDENKIIISYSESFHHGVIGIVASKICDKYYKPTIIMELKNDGTAVASARSIENFNFIKAIDSMSELFLRYGGHECAAGFSIKISEIENFEKRINQYADKILTKEDLLKKIKIDEEIFAFKISYDFYKKLEKLEPFGSGNPHPSFLIKKVQLKNIKKIGQTKDHLMFDVISKSTTIKSCVWFGAGHHIDSLMNSDYFDVNFKIDISLYQGKHYIKLFVVDIKSSQDISINKLDFFSKIYDITFPIETVVYTKYEIDDSPFKIKLEENYNEIPLSQNGKTVAFLNEKSSYLLKILNKYYNQNFNIKLIKKETSNFHHSLFFSIDKEYLPVIYSLNDKTVFRKLNEFLRSGIEYNTVQKSILGSLFRKKQSTLFVGDFNRGINEVILNCGLYFKITENKKSLIVSKDKLNPIYQNYFDISDKYLNDYPFVIFINLVPNEDLDSLSFVYSEKDINLEKYTKIFDDFYLPQNIEIVSESKLLALENSKSQVFFDKIPIQDKKEILNNIDKYTKIYSTKDILKYL